MYIQYVLQYGLSPLTYGVRDKINEHNSTMDIRGVQVRKFLKLKVLSRTLEEMWFWGSLRAACVTYLSLYQQRWAPSQEVSPVMDRAVSRREMHTLQVNGLLMVSGAVFPWALFIRATSSESDQLPAKSTTPLLLATALGFCGGIVP